MKNKDQKLLTEAYEKVLNEIQSYDEGDAAEQIQKFASGELANVEADIMNGEFGSAYGKLEQLMTQMKPLIDDIFLKKDTSEDDLQNFQKDRMSLKFGEDQTPSI